MEPELGPGDANVLYRDVSSSGRRELDRTRGRVHLASLCLGIKLTHSIHGDQKSFIVSAIQNIS